jgi:hypothetical protein
MGCPSFAFALIQLWLVCNYQCPKALLAITGNVSEF